MSAVHAPPAINRQQAIAIAEADAIPVYGDLNDLTLEATLLDDGWHIDYWVRKPRHAGGGPHYVIHPETGEIVSKKYYQ
ncbi:MAG TPA: hypothetical protein VH092_13205 [Urbifossiella sp.]|jgi:hypothetical protein|nr:hypothetical protein [Urbifossiella sp.]